MSKPGSSSTLPQWRASLDMGLFRAVKADDAEKIARLIKKGADPSARDFAGFDPLMLAARDGRMKALGLLLSKCDPFAVNDKRAPYKSWGTGRAVDLAAHSGRPEAMAMLFRAMLEREGGHPERLSRVDALSALKAAAAGSAVSGAPDPYAGAYFRPPAELDVDGKSKECMRLAIEASRAPDGALPFAVADELASMLLAACKERQLWMMRFLLPLVGAWAMGKNGDTLLSKVVDGFPASASAGPAAWARSKRADSDMEALELVLGAMEASGQAERTQAEAARCVSRLAASNGAPDLVGAAMARLERYALGAAGRASGEAPDLAKPARPRL